MAWDYIGNKYAQNEVRAAQEAGLPFQEWQKQNQHAGSDMMQQRAAAFRQANGMPTPQPTERGTVQLGPGGPMGVDPAMIQQMIQQRQAQRNVGGAGGMQGPMPQQGVQPQQVNGYRVSRGVRQSESWDDPAKRQQLIQGARAQQGYTGWQNPQQAQQPQQGVQPGMPGMGPGGPMGVNPAQLGMLQQMIQRRQAMRMMPGAEAAQQANQGRFQQLGGGMAGMGQGAMLPPEAQAQMANRKRLMELAAAGGMGMR